MYKHTANLFLPKILTRHKKRMSNNLAWPYEKAFKSYVFSYGYTRLLDTRRMWRMRFFSAVIASATRNCDQWFSRACAVNITEIEDGRLWPITTHNVTHTDGFLQYSQYVQQWKNHYRPLGRPNISCNSNAVPLNTRTPCKQQCAMANSNHKSAYI